MRFFILEECAQRQVHRVRQALRGPLLPPTPLRGAGTLAGTLRDEPHGVEGGGRQGQRKAATETRQFACQIVNRIHTTAGRFLRAEKSKA